MLKVGSKHNQEEVPSKGIMKIENRGPKRALQLLSHLIGSRSKLERNINSNSSNNRLSLRTSGNSTQVEAIHLDYIRSREHQSRTR